MDWFCRILWHWLREEKGDRILSALGQFTLAERFVLEYFELRSICVVDAPFTDFQETREFECKSMQLGQVAIKGENGLAFDLARWFDKGVNLELHNMHGIVDCFTFAFVGLGVGHASGMSRERHHQIVVAFA